uniref:Variable lymphocyte receptor A cassette n=1 Tax=Petromyzon marinus TaxID=7757 RepID=S4R8Z9_PETMA
SYIDQNQLQSFSPGVFDHLPELRTLGLPSNRL